MSGTPRRRFLATAGAVVTAGLAGCSDGNSNVNGEETSLPAPSVDTQNGVWEQADSGKITKKVDNVGTAKGKMLTFTHQPSLEQVKEKTRGKFNQSVGIGFAAQFELDGAVISNVPLWVMASDIKESFRTRLKQRDISGIEETEPPVSGVTPSGTENANKSGFVGSYPTGEFEMDVELRGGETRTFRFLNYELPIEALFCIWKKDGDLYAAGGVWPGEKYMQRTRWVNVTGEGVGDGADARVRVTLPFMRSEIRSDVVSLVESTS